MFVFIFSLVSVYSGACRVHFGKERAASWVVQVMADLVCVGSVWPGRLSVSVCVRGCLVCACMCVRACVYACV